LTYSVMKILSHRFWWSWSK